MYSTVIDFENIENSIYEYCNITVNYCLNDLLSVSFGCNNLLNIQTIDSETLISSFHNSETSGTPISCGRYLFTSLKLNLSYDK